MRLAILALLFGVALGANLDISDNIAPTNEQSAVPMDNQAPTNATNPNNAISNDKANQTTNQAVNPAQNPSENQTNQAQSTSETNQAQNQTNQNNANQTNQTQSTPQAQQPQPKQTTKPKPQKVAKPRPSDPDERLKEDIVSFEREQYFQDNANIDDPFIYVYQQTEDEVAIRAQLEQAVLTLKSIIIAPDSNNSRIKRYKAHINNQWVEECRVARKSKECDSVEGWEVVSINEDSVKLRVARYNMKRDLQLMNKKVTIKKADNYK